MFEIGDKVRCNVEYYSDVKMGDVKTIVGIDGQYLTLEGLEDYARCYNQNDFVSADAVPPELKPLMLVKRADNSFRLVVDDDFGELYLTDHTFTLRLDEYDSNLKCKKRTISGYDIMAIYGKSKRVTDACKLLTEDRELLWQRPQVEITMTMAEVMEQLGYDNSIKLIIKD